jgi:hypothetical protein
MEIAFSRQILEKYSNTKFNENPSSGSRVVPCGHTDGLPDGQMDIQTDGRTDRHYEVNIRFSKIFPTRLKVRE